MNFYISILEKILPITRFLFFALVFFLAFACKSKEVSAQTSEFVPSPEQRGLMQKELEKRKQEIETYYRLEAKNKNCTKEFNRIIEGFRPWRTIKVKYVYGLSFDRGKTWDNLTKELIADKSKGQAFLSTKKTEKENKGYQHEFFNNGQVISYGVAYRKSGKRESRGIIRRKEVNWLPSTEWELLNYTWFSENGSFWDDGFTLPDLKITKTVYKGKDAIKFSDFPQPKSTDGKSKFDLQYIFDSTTGMLLYKEIYIKSEDSELCQKTKITDYILSNGLFFPKRIEFEDKNSMHRFTITSVEINEPIPDEVFKPRIPYGCRIKDEINNTTYITPSLGNSGAEEEISKSLDELVKEAKKAK